MDELILLDILASQLKKEPDFELIKEVSEECFMPLTYGGGIRSVEHMRKILSIGVEKIAINTSAVTNPKLINEAANVFGSQCIIVSIDIKKNLFGDYVVATNNGSNKTNLDPVKFAIDAEKLGAGELLITSIDNDGTWQGYDIDLTKSITDNVNIPVIANGGAGKINDIDLVLNYGNASAAGVGSYVVFQKQGYGVLINFPKEDDISKII